MPKNRFRWEEDDIVITKQPTGDDTLDEIEEIIEDEEE